SQSGLDTLPQTLGLIRDSQTVLTTQSDQSSAIRQFSTDLDALTAQLRTSDPDIRRVIDNGIPASEQVGALVRDGGPALTTDLSNLASTARTLTPRTISLQPLLIFMPGLAAASPSAINADGATATVRQGLVLEMNNPLSCTVGYEGTMAILDEMKRKDPNFDDTQQDFPVNTAASCLAPQGSETGVRSANRVVFADPNTPQPWDDKPKVDPDKLNLNPIATQLAPGLGVTPK
ncbi:MAG: mammalian cell entry protein, partial [Rhodococcus erythropolis]|nr:mammalian cell entry protein [Rhodococcus erythropolis]